MTARRWIAYWPVQRNGEEHRRYVQQPGYKTYRGWGNRRYTGTVHAVLTDDREKAFRWRSPSEAKKAVAKTYNPAHAARFGYEKTEEQA